MKGYRKAARVMKALAHPIRLQILEALLEEGEACVCHLEALLGRRQAYISQQLSKLREAGLILDRRDGLNIFYSIADDRIAGLLEEAKHLTMNLARSNGLELAFPALRQLHPERCKCPNCGQALTLAAQG